MMFKVPGLRNVAETGPYFHDGSVATLEGAVSTMAKHQLGLELEPEEVDAVVAWLKSLTGKLPQQYQAPRPEAARRQRPLSGRLAKSRTCPPPGALARTCGLRAR